MTFQNIKRQVKNFLFCYSNTEIYVRKITCNDPCKLKHEEMAKVVELSFDSLAVIKVMMVIEKRIGDYMHDQHVLKASFLLDHLLEKGIPAVFEISNRWHHKIQKLAKWKWCKNEDTNKKIRDLGQNMLVKFVKWNSESTRLTNIQPQANNRNVSSRLSTVSGNTSNNNGCIKNSSRIVAPRSSREEELHLRYACQISKLEEDNRVLLLSSQVNSSPQTTDCSENQQIGQNASESTKPIALKDLQPPNLDTLKLSPSTQATMVLPQQPYEDLDSFSSNLKSDSMSDSKIAASGENYASTNPFLSSIPIQLPPKGFAATKPPSAKSLPSGLQTPKSTTSIQLTGLQNTFDADYIGSSVEINLKNEDTNKEIRDIDHKMLVEFEKWKSETKRLTNIQSEANNLNVSSRGTIQNSGSIKNTSGVMAPCSSKEEEPHLKYFCQISKPEEDNRVLLVSSQANFSPQTTECPPGQQMGQNASESTKSIASKDVQPIGKICGSTNPFLSSIPIQLPLEGLAVIRSS